MKKALEIVREIQSQYPAMHVGGSIGLFLHGITLTRFSDWKGDIDMTTDKIVPLNASFDTQRCSFDDFEMRYKKNGIGIDIAEDPEQKYDTIFFEGFNYSVTQLERILYYKCAYAIKGVDKHRADMYEICGKHYEPKTPDDLPF